MKSSLDQTMGLAPTRQEGWREGTEKKKGGKK
jgi:hypothetical protein